MQSQLTLKLRNTLKKHIKDNISDIFIIGSTIKNKIEPRDFDIIVLFKEKNLKKVEDSLFNINESINFVKNKHIEPLFVSSMFKEKIFLTIMHEGFSVNNNKKVSEIIGLKSYSIFSYNLENLSKINKVRFAQALYGRKKDGLLYAEGGISLGNGSFMVLVYKEQIFKELFSAWKVKYSYRRAFVSD